MRDSQPIPTPAKPNNNLKNPQQEEFEPESQNNKFPILVFAVVITILLGFIGFILLGKNILNKQGKIAEVYNQENYGITINSGNKIQDVSPTFFGAGLHWTTHGMERNLGFDEQPVDYIYADEVVDLIKNLNLDVIRFGGADYDWTWKRNSELDHPLSEKYGTDEWAVGMRNWFQYGLGINQYINLLNTINAFPYWMVNIQEGNLLQDVCAHRNPANLNEYPGTVQETRELARYFKDKLTNNKPVYWTFDLEPWLYFGDNCQGKTHWTVQQYVDRVKQHIAAIKETYPNARFAWSIPGLNRYWPNWDSARQKQWLDYIAQNAGDDFQAVSFTNFYHPENSEDYLKVGEDVKWAIGTLKNNLQQTGKNIEIDVNGFGLLCLDDEIECRKKQMSVAGNLGLAQIFQEYLRQGVKVAQQESLVHETSDPIIEATQRNVLITSGGGPVWSRMNKPPQITSLYTIQKLLTDHTGTEIVKSSTTVENVDVLTSSKDNTLYTLIINKNNEIKHLPISLESGVILENPARAWVVGNGVSPHQLTDLGATEIRPGYVQVGDNLVDFYAEPYSVSVVEIDYSQPIQAELTVLYRGWCPNLWEYLLTDDRQELENNKCEDIKEIGNVFKSQIEGTEALQRYWLVGLAEHFQTAIPSEKEHVTSTAKYQAKDDRVLGFVYVLPKEGTVPLYQTWCGDGWLKKHFFTTNEDEINNVTTNSWKCQNKAIAGYLLP